MDLSLYPWQKSDYNYLLKLKKRMPQALLLYGASSLGTKQLALNFVRSVLCQDSGIDGEFCGKCNSCVLIANESHPDLYNLTLEPDEKSISIASIRNVVEFLATSTHLGQNKVVLIDDVGLLNINSANALLKILEEPPHYTVFVLLSDNINKLLPTIISRCHKYKITSPNNAEAIKYLANKDIPNLEFWLNYYDNSPLFELEIDDEQLTNIINTLSTPSVENIYSFINSYDIKKSQFLCEFLEKWICDLARYKMSGKLYYFVQYKSSFDKLADKLNTVEKIFYLLDKLTFLIEWSNHPLNFKLQLENIFFQYQQVFV